VWWHDGSFVASWLWAAGAGVVVGSALGFFLIPRVGVLPGLVFGVVFAAFLCLAFLGAAFIVCWVVGDVLLAIARLKQPVGHHVSR
jgi:hypothetical protein